MIQSQYQLIDKNDIKVGDTVYTLSFPQYGWSSCFRYPILKCHKIARITPKRTKFVTEKGVEYTDNTNFYKLDDVLTHDSIIAGYFQYCYKYSSDINPNALAKLSDDELKTVYDSMKAIMEILHKH